MQRFTQPLRTYQQILKEKLEETEYKTNTILQAPTGSGKGNLIVERALDQLERGEKVLIVTPSLDLVDNLTERFKVACPDFCKIHMGVVATGHKFYTNRKLQIGVYKSIYNNRHFLKGYNFIIHDEVHHSKSKTWQGILDYFTDSYHEGYTATPRRLDGKPLDGFKRLILSPPVEWFIENNYLSSFVLKSAADVTLDKKGFADSLDIQEKLFNNKAQIGKAIDNWRKHAYGTKTIIFATTIDHAYKLAEEFNQEFANETINGKPIRFAVLESNLKPAEREKVKQDYIKGEYIGIINVAILTEGVDIPDVETVLLCRFTWSLAFYIQMIGRCLRYVAGKTAIILDPVGNALEHGSPSMDHEWSLEGSKVLGKEYMCCCSLCEMPLIHRSKVAKIGKGGINIVCPNCFTENFFEIIPVPRIKQIVETEIIDSDLVEFSADRGTLKILKILRGKKKIQDKTMAIVNLEGVSRELKYKALRALEMPDPVIQVYLGRG